jgi:hypothetical protein
MNERRRSDEEVANRLWLKLASHEAAKKAYAQIPSTRNGRILSVDDARELSPDYQADRSRSAAVHEPASAFIKKLYAERLKEPVPPGGLNSVVMMGGGTGAGKTSALRSSPNADLLAGRAHAIYDTNMNSFPSAKEKIDAALAAGHHVHVMAVQRHPVDALVNGALPRAMRQEARDGTGRTVPLSSHLATHIGAAETIPKLAKHYQDNPRVHFTYIDNSGGPGQAREIDPSLWKQYSRGEMKKALEDALEHEHKVGRISEKVYRGFKES